MTQRLRSGASVPGAPLLLLLLAALPAAAQTTPAPLGCPAGFERTVVELVNRERTSRGLTPLEPDVRLMEAAQLHSADMATSDFLSHEGSDGSRPGDRIEAAGYDDWRAWGENAAAGYPTPTAVVAGWMGSTGHRANILDPGFEHIGVGYRYAAGTSWGHYWTQDFGAAASPAALPVASCPACANALDDDGDGDLDADQDVGCRDAAWTTESPQCSDGINNDPGLDEWIDFDGGASAGLPEWLRTAPDPQCVVAGQPAPWKASEAPSGSCGLGFELALILPLLRCARRRGTRGRG
jgi:uncharacterized protein YkwD